MGEISTNSYGMEEDLKSKRKHGSSSYYGEPPAKRPVPSIRVGAGFQWNLQALSNAADAVESGGKSPVSALNELGVKVTYTLLRQGGPPHCPNFNVAVNVADMRFEGVGHSKREARAAAARACLAALLTRAGRVLPTEVPADLDFTNDVDNIGSLSPVNHYFTNDVDSIVVKKEEVPKSKEPAENAPVEKPEPSSSPVPNTEPTCPSAALFGSVPAPALHKSPINMLYETFPGLTFNCTFGDGSSLAAPQAPLQLSHSMRFKVVCQIKDQSYEGYECGAKFCT